MTWDRVERLVGKDNLQRLAEKKVGIIGLGSGGGFVAQSLAMSGVGQFVLVDDDVLEESNLVRHVADRRDVGHPKAEIMAELITLRNPDAHIDLRVGRIEHYMDVLDGLDLCVVAVDHELSKYKLNEVLLAHNITAVYAGVYERGEGGDVVVIRPWDGPCYACWSNELRDGLQISMTGGELDYGMIGPEGTLEAEPGLWIHVVRVAAAQVDFVLHELLSNTNVYEKFPGNTVILANKSLEIIEGEVTPPHSAVWVQIERDPDCMVCGDAVRARRAGEGTDDEMSLDDLATAMHIEMEDEGDHAQSRGH